LLEKNLKDMQRLAQLKSEAAALAAQPSAVAPAAAASAVAATSAVQAASEVAAASEVKPAPVAKPKPKPQPVVVPQPSLTDEILGNPLYLAGGAAILLGLGGLGFMLNRRRQAAAPGGKGEDAGAITGHLTPPAAPSPETGDFTSTTGEHAAAAAVTSEEVDPISEADLFLNFGRDVQAEEILKEALQNTPNDHRIHLKLLGIYANRKDVNSFSSIARQLKDSGDEEAWQQAAAMGRKLEPNNPMYGGTGTIEDDGSATMQTTVLSAMPDIDLGETAAPEVDFDLGGTEKTATLSTEEKAAAQAEAMDFDITSTSPSLAAAPEAMDFDVTSTSPSMSAPTEMDFDITSTSPSMPAAAEEKEAALPNLDDLVFDVTATHPSTPAAEPGAKAAPADEGGMEFTLDFPIEAPAEKPASAAQSAETGFAGISLNLEDIGAPGEPAAEGKDEHWHEVATKLDLAKAYQEMGDLTGAREILEEVLREGDEGQREAAQSMLDQIG
jgi:pilus assembly protein FimV